mmetsp:Transcript_16025/g.49926  ORF Transcript_16025/g.49926 Transcript_16025/m.49926 type:complete len:240 (+) Transcript_16025:818-1537(+)
MLVCATQHDRTRLSIRAAAKSDELVLTDHDLLDRRGLAERDRLGRVEGRDDVRARDVRELSHALKVGVLDHHDARVDEPLLGQVVDELAVDEDVAAVRDDLVHLRVHLGALRRLDLRHLGHRVGLDLGAVELDLVRVHRRVGEQDLRADDLLGAVGGDLLVEQVPVWVEVRVAQRAARLLDELDLLEVRRPLELHHRIDGHLGELLLVLREDLGRERGLRDLDQVRAEPHRVGRVVDRH